ncbi:ParA family protein [Chromobacterium sp. IIBBL 290-4]|uniref:ParA family protein n=1 Tax=Chromobacterium sp. IIBBL 290-4 TaxID=2953890 RepID=UPI0020B82352|nr:ParA family protein [Chromobacterium sp. IIBBL 290-4]UTH73413.1 ParA family protein [Chromobacterium sp. IIBBL 290-4]
MQSVLIANPKGGSGKSTLATNLAAYFAASGKKVMLGDVDRQQTSLHWLSQRHPDLPGIAGWEVEPNEPKRPPKGTELVVLDSPAGLHGKKLSNLLSLVDHVIVPVQPSPFDMWATEAFFEQVLEEKAIRKSKVQLAVVGMRVDSRTKLARELEQFLDRLEVPVLSWLRDTQLYGQAAAEGMSLFDLPISRAARDREEWQPILRWLGDDPHAWCDK